MLIHIIQGKLSGDNNFLIEHTKMCNFLRGSDKILASIKKKNNTINAKIIFFGFKLTHDCERDFRKKNEKLIFKYYLYRIQSAFCRLHQYCYRWVEIGINVPRCMLRGQSRQVAR